MTAMTSLSLFFFGVWNVGGAGTYGLGVGAWLPTGAAPLGEVCPSVPCGDMGAPQAVQNLQVSGTNAPHSVQYIVFLSVGCVHADATLKVSCETV